MTIPDESQDNVGGKNPTNSAPEITSRLYKGCHCENSVSSLLADDPSLAPKDAWHKLIYDHELMNSRHSDELNTQPYSVGDDEGLRQARECGNWGSNEPSGLFTRLYHDALCTLEDNPERGVVSPRLMGSSGIVPLTIISVVPDIVRHMSNLIVRAQKEVFLATNFWQNGTASRYITDAMRELSRRAQARGTRVVMKIIYDRGNPRQVFDPHYVVSESEYTGDAVNLPPKNDIPNIDLEVMNYHQPVLGTFHAKYMIVDRKIAIVQSNNIQDNDNLEMMVQVEGPIVDSLYDMAMISWHKKLDPPLPCLHSPATNTRAETSFDANYSNVFSSSGSIKGHSVVVDPSKMPPRKSYGAEARQTSSHNPESEPRTLEQIESLPEHTTEDPHYDASLVDEVLRVQSVTSAKPGESAMQAVSRHLNHTLNAGYLGDAPECEPEDEMTPYIPHAVHEPFPIAMVNRFPYGQPNHRSITTPQNAAWLSALRNAQRNVFISDTDSQCLTPDPSYWRNASHAGRPQRQDRVPAIHNTIRRRAPAPPLALVCRTWIDALRRNQNTGIYGAVDREDGIWRDEQGKGVEGATGVDAGHFSWVTGLVGAVRRLQGTGGF
ncbi:hypothetical protein NPX13_g2023 [Xylaria arbuscula]|uniref:PLD phosphodiesterase domain-containing protein n=1 Tax=Xylaria arbuscula TaxID=114810 RepID=A0A9W8NL85_9PEZI|nr:hypothetical protein NPX13_g2023 [Xylaria arbuscula]